MRAFIFSFLLFVGTNVTAMQNEEKVVLNEDSITKEALTLSQPEEGTEQTMHFGRQEALEAYLTKLSGTEIWDQMKPQPGQNMNEFMAKNPMFILMAQTQFCTVREIAPRFWDKMLAQLPEKTFTVKEFVTLMSTIGEEVYKEEIEASNDPSVGFMIAMQTKMQLGKFISMFVSMKKESQE